MYDQSHDGFGPPGPAKPAIQAYGLRRSLFVRGAKTGGEQPGRAVANSRNFSPWLYVPFGMVPESSFHTGVAYLLDGFSYLLLPRVSRGLFRNLPDGSDVTVSIGRSERVDH